VGQAPRPQAYQAPVTPRWGSAERRGPLIQCHQRERTKGNTMTDTNITAASDAARLRLRLTDAGDAAYRAAYARRAARGVDAGDARPRRGQDEEA
jgi:hypothetical protein